MRPLREADDTLLASYEALFSAGRFSFIELTPSVIERATVLRASHGFKTPDALHLAAAIEANADVFLIGDEQLARCTVFRTLACRSVAGRRTKSVRWFDGASDVRLRPPDASRRTVVGDARLGAEPLSRDA